MLKRFLTNALCKIINFLGLRNIIVMEIEPNRSDNTEVLCRRILEENWNRKHRIVLISENPEKLSYLNSKNIKAYNRNGGTAERLRMTAAKMRARLLIDCNVQLNKVNPRTVHIYLTHGSPVKSTKDYYTCRDDTDYIVGASEFWREVLSDELRIDSSKLFVAGAPRCDDLFADKADMEKMFGKKLEKVIAWYPTFRQHKHGKYQDGISIPVIHNEQAAIEIDRIAQKYNVLVVIKPHPAQNVAKIKELNLNNILIINDEKIAAYGVNSYEFLAKTDALITDYSSILWDYLITDKPLALTHEDYEEYKARIGFAIDINMIRNCAEMLNTPEDFERFFRNLTEGKDTHKEIREKTKNITNEYSDANSSSRFIRIMDKLIEDGHL